jgi:outer membrane protein OmpA-like peptidoglycan-associated protein
MRTLLVLVVAIGTTYAQPNVLVREDFSSNSWRWEVDDHKAIVDGAFVFNAPEDGDQAFINVFLDPQKDFVISVECTQKTGLTGGGFGIAWGVSGDHYNLFMISSNQHYAVFNGNPVHLKSWKDSPVIQSLGQTNTLKIEHQSGKISFYINNVKVDERKEFQHFGNWIGFVVLSQMQVTFDNFIIQQHQVIDFPEKVETFASKENLGAGVNTADDELGPIISSDGKTLYFARQNVSENIGGVYDDEDVWISHWQNAQWSTAVNMGRTVNSSLADNLIAVSTDNNTMIFEKDDAIFVRHRTATGWSDVENIDIAFKNEYDYFVASLSADGKVIVFSAMLKQNVKYDAKRSEGDLYVCIKDKNNKWSSPLNLGVAVNTAGDETSPFLSADGRTLYFATDGRPGYGYQDIFFTRRTGESWTEWSKPLNLGPGVNTKGFDAYYTTSASGEHAYFVSYDNGFGKADIFRIAQHDHIKSNPVIMVKGFVVNKTTKAPLGATIHFENLVNGNEMGEARSDPKTGAYQIVLPVGTHYGIRANLNDFYSVHTNLELQENATYNEVNHDLLMVPIEIGETIALNNIFFEAGSPILRSESFPELDRLVKILLNNTGVHIEIEGHTDNRGDAAALMKLSHDRVITVKDYLIKNGIAASRISGKGYGATKPIASGDTEENRRLNRRVEFKIMKK